MGQKLVYPLLLFIVEIFILFACLEFMQTIYNNDILPDKLVKETFPQTPCLIISKKLSEKGTVVHRYRADFLVSYTVNGTPFQDWVTGNGLDQSYFHDRDPQQSTLDQFEVGQSYNCWYDPKTPENTVLVLRHDWAATLPLAVPSIIGLIVLYYLLKSSLQFLGFIRMSLRKK